MDSSKSKGERRTFWIPAEIDAIIEDTRRKIGMGRSAFYRYAVFRLLEQMEVLTQRATQLPGNPNIEEKLQREVAK